MPATQRIGHLCRYAISQYWRRSIGHADCIGVLAIYGRCLFIYLLLKSGKHICERIGHLRHISVNGRYADTQYRPADVLTYMPTDNFLGDQLTVYKTVGPILSDVVCLTSCL